MADRAEREVDAGPRGFGRTLLAGLTGSALATAAATRGWAEATTTETGARTAVASGADVAPLVLPLALVALAAWGTVLVLRRRGRRVVAVIGLASSLVAGIVGLLRAEASAGVALEVLGAGEGAATSTTPWPYLAVAGCLLSAAASVVAVVRAGQWPEMSPRYDAPGDRRSQQAGSDMWKALDQGEDPTA